MEVRDSEFPHRHQTVPAINSGEYSKFLLTLFPIFSGSGAVKYCVSERGSMLSAFNVYFKNQFKLFHSGTALTVQYIHIKAILPVPL